MQINAKNTKLYNNLVTLFQQQQLNKIAKIYQKNRDKGKLDSSIWNIFAETHSRLGNYQEVAYCCKQIVAQNPGNYQAIYNMALSLQHLNKINEAIAAYEECIKINNQYFNAFANCASLYQSKGQYDKAINYFLLASKLEDNPEVKTQLGRSYADSGDTTSAINTYQHIINKDQNNDKARFYLAQLYYEIEDYSNSEIQYLHLYQKNKKDIRVINNLGRLYEQAFNLEKAVDYFNQALDIDNKLGIIHRNLGRVLVKAFNYIDKDKYFDKAVQTLIKSIEIEPEHPEPYFELGRLYHQSNENDKAIDYYSKALALDIPADFDNAEEFILAAKYFLSSVNNPDDFNADKKDYIADLFDGYADKFDKHLVENLEYRTPEIISEKISSLLDNEKKYDIIDLGCGTGLCAPFLSDYSKTLTGIDLSGKMIEKAKPLNLYDELIVGDITEEILATNKQYDLVIAADVFVYIGPLADIFSACYEKMRDDGLFIFSTELYDEGDEDYRIFGSGRYKHSLSYLSHLAEEYNFEILSNEECKLRKEYDSSVMGTLSVLKKIPQ